MDEEIPWTGGISNRQILVDSVVGSLRWMAIAILLGVFLFWVSGFLPIPHAFRFSIAAIGGVLASQARFIKRRRHA